MQRTPGIVPSGFCVNLPVRQFRNFCFSSPVATQVIRVLWVPPAWAPGKASTVPGATGGAVASVTVVLAGATTLPAGTELKKLLFQTAKSPASTMPS